METVAGENYFHVGRNHVEIEIEIAEIEIVEIETRRAAKDPAEK